VLQDLATYLPATLELATAAILIAVFIGIPTGILSALFRDRWQDQLARGFALLGVSLPVFYLGLLLLGVLYNELGWFPGPGELGPYTTPPPRLTGMVVVDAALAGEWGTFLDAVAHLVLPAFVLGLYSSGLVMRVMRSSMLEALRQEYMRTAHAKGLSQSTVVMRHGFRNALIPTVTVASLAYGGLLSGAVLTETIFSWPGIGHYATDSVVNLDLPAIMGVTLVAALTYSTINLIVDFAYAYLDPRIRIGT
jgi:peptide/nickel transport system permease protein